MKKMLTKKISFIVQAPAQVSMKIYDAIGNFIATVVNENKPVGIYNVEFSAENESVTNPDVIKLRSGSYMYKLRIGNTIETKRMDLQS